eukprot:1851532-Rhodomonas_salina.2
MLLVQVGARTADAGELALQSGRPRGAAGGTASAEGHHQPLSLAGRRAASPGRGAGERGGGRAGGGGVR